MSGRSSKRNGGQIATEQTKRARSSNEKDEDNGRTQSVKSSMASNTDSSFNRTLLLKEIIKFVSSIFSVVDVNIEKSLETVEIRIRTQRRNVKIGSEVIRLRETLKPYLGVYDLAINVIEEIPVIEYTTRKPGLGSKFFAVDKRVGVFVRGRGEYILSSAHNLKQDDEMIVEGDVSPAGGIELDLRVVGKVKTIINQVGDKNLGTIETVDAALIALDPSSMSNLGSRRRGPGLNENDLMEIFYLRNTVRQNGEERGISSEVADAVLNKRVVKVCDQNHQEPVVLGTIIKTDLCSLDAGLWNCILIERFSKYAKDDRFHLPGESGVVVAYNPGPNTNTLTTVAMIIASYKYEGKWYSLAVPLKLILSRLSEKLRVDAQLIYTQ